MILNTFFHFDNVSFDKADKAFSAGFIIPIINGGRLVTNACAVLQFLLRYTFFYTNLFAPRFFLPV